MDAEEEGLECKPELLLYAFELAGPYATGKSHKAKLEHRMELALSLVDWAITECDRGVKLMEAESELAILRSQNKGGGAISIGPFGG